VHFEGEEYVCILPRVWRTGKEKESNVNRKRKIIKCDFSQSLQEMLGWYRKVEHDRFLP
jgi:hypothetical protein